MKLSIFVTTALVALIGASPALAGRVDLQTQPVAANQQIKVVTVRQGGIVAPSMTTQITLLCTGTGDAEQCAVIKTESASSDGIVTTVAPSVLYAMGSVGSAAALRPARTTVSAVGGQGGNASGASATATGGSAQGGDATGGSSSSNVDQSSTYNDESLNLYDQRSTYNDYSSNEYVNEDNSRGNNYLYGNGNITVSTPTTGTGIIAPPPCCVVPPANPLPVVPPPPPPPPVFLGN